jgi:hypothetical protein
MSRRLLVCGLFAILGSGYAAAQSAEETVVFLLYGDYAGKLKEVRKDLWEIRKDGALDAQIAIAKRDSCRYTLELRDPSGKAHSIRTVDFTKWWDHKLEPLPGARNVYVLTLQGATETRKSVRSGEEHVIDPISEAYSSEELAHRARRAATYFRSTFCKGRAF